MSYNIRAAILRLQTSDNKAAVRKEIRAAGYGLPLEGGGYSKITYDAGSEVFVIEEGCPAYHGTICFWVGKGN